MQNLTEKDPTGSPFHIGEQRIQTRVGKRDTMENFGRKVIRSFMPDQHREFYAQLPFLVIGSVDEQGWPWASILSNKPGFAQSPDPTTLKINTAPLAFDPLGDVIKPNTPIGLLGIDISTRRRNRLNARITESDPSGFSLKVDQAFGNCPQYIQTRSVDFIPQPDSTIKPQDLRRFTTLSKADRTLISNADTFFVSSYIKPEDNPQIEGVDVSHRGGKPGFVKIDGNTLTIPDYSGNFHFNTLGNFLLNPKAGLVFMDFESGDVLMLTGTVEILWEDEPEVKAFKGAERAWRFTLDHGLRLNAALPFRSTFQQYSPNTQITGDWQQAEAVLSAQAKGDKWRAFRLSRVVDESSVIRSFYLEPADGGGLLPFQAGQFLTIRLTPQGSQQPVIRTYTLSSSPADQFYRISVKREPDGLVSKHLHDGLTLGSVIEVKAPQGDFFIDANVRRPAVLIAGGVGITPMISMAQHIANEGARTRYMRQVTIFHAAQTTQQRAFADAFHNLERKTEGVIRYYSFISRPTTEDKPGEDFNGAGYITADVIRQVLALDDYDFYLCGPSPFMQSQYDMLRELGVRDSRIFAEAFGPAAITRKVDEGKVTAEPDEAEEAIIKFAKSDFEQRWNKGDKTILEVAESHGLTPAFGCRTGNCGSCAVKLISGSVSYRQKPIASYDEKNVLICCAVPNKESSTLEIDL